ncbi:hypothetical protein GWI33_006425 [Rhynchophorus ferrugineus]|uniref:Uncharacterized protein n=1 Tax=Rhynchophorus ferrugineus TaxID=354439 RepID=A0A834IG43_RHYFE|nr:hypothetical protein GWI33_006425 [Rhynchophorus ferrugineus]
MARPLLSRDVISARCNAPTSSTRGRTAHEADKNGGCGTETEDVRIGQGRERTIGCIADVFWVYSVPSACLPACLLPTPPTTPRYQTVVTDCVTTGCD